MPQTKQNSVYKIERVTTDNCTRQGLQQWRGITTGSKWRQLPLGASPEGRKPLGLDFWNKIIIMSNSWTQ